jgi:hypothetical protein
MKMKFPILLLLQVATLCSFAQGDPEIKEQKSHFAGQFHLGILEGGSTTSFQVQALAGIKKKDWFTGVGTGLDYYFQRSVPVYISVSRYHRLLGQNFFVQGEGGMNFAWKRNVVHDWDNVISDTFKPGLYWNGGIGFSASLGKGNAMMISLGYSYKHLQETKEFTVFCINPPCPPQKEEYDYHLRRLSLKFGWLISGN